MDDDFDFERAATAFPDISLGSGDGSFATAEAPSLPLPRSRLSLGGGSGGGDDGFAAFDFGSPSAFGDVHVTRDDEIGRFEDQFPALDVGAPVSSPPPLLEAATARPTFGAAPPFAPRPQPSALSQTPILSQQLDDDEPEAIRQWREGQAEEIRARDEASKARRQETISKAEKAIDQFYEGHAATKEGAIRENKNVEAEFLETLHSSLTKGTTWERICEMIELHNSQSKTVARTGPGTTDLLRFREVLLRLRREGDAAPGAGGY